MDLLEQARNGFQTIDADAAFPEQALKFLGQWLTRPEFTAYRPQLEWLIQTQQWSGLLDRFYQILPFGTGGRPGAGRLRSHRTKPLTPTASRHGPFHEPQ